MFLLVSLSRQQKRTAGRIQLVGNSSRPPVATTVRLIVSSHCAGRPPHIFGDPTVDLEDSSCDPFLASSRTDAIAVSSELLEAELC